MRSKDPYEILGIQKGVEFQDVKKAYKKLAAKFHPDKNGGDSDKFKEITWAFGLLKSMDDCQDDSDVFLDEDMSASVSLTLEEMVFGCSKKVSVHVGSVLCTKCSGSGSASGSPMMPCVSCMGTGKIQGVWGFSNSHRQCSTCKGSGTVPAQLCQHCYGKGVSQGKVDVSVNIPAGVDDGQEIVFKITLGQHIRRLFLYVSGTPHKTFDRVGDDLVTSCVLNVLDAMSGCKTSVLGLDGVPIDVHVPQLFCPGDKITIEGMGVRNSQTGRTGDLAVNVRVKMPKKLSVRALKLLEELSNEVKKR